MKRFLLFLAVGLLINASVFTQDDFDQRVIPTLDIELEGVSGAHKAYPIGSAIKVTNTKTGDVIDVIIIKKIHPLENRKLDLSKTAWEMLNLTEETLVELILPAAPPQNVTIQVEEEPSVPPDTLLEEELPVPPDTLLEEEPPVPSDTSQKLYHLLVLDRIQSELYADIGDAEGISILYKFLHGKDGYLIAVYSSSGGGPVFPPLPENARILLDMTATRKSTLKSYAASAAFRRHVSNRRVLAEIQKTLEGPTVLEDFAVKEGPTVKVIPALPNPNSGKIYRLQVGAFTSREAADYAAQRVADAGFEVGEERYGSWYRVLAVNVRAANAASTIRTLGEAGFTEVWVRE